jgi:hypothetical protein
MSILHSPFWTDLLIRQPCWPATLSTQNGPPIRSQSAPTSSTWSGLWCSSDSGAAWPKLSTKDFAQSMPSHTHSSPRNAKTEFPSPTIAIGVQDVQQTGSSETGGKPTSVSDTPPVGSARCSAQSDQFGCSEGDKTAEPTAEQMALAPGQQSCQNSQGGGKGDRIRMQPQGRR